MPGYNKDSGQKCVTLGDTTSDNYHHNKRLWDLKLTNCNQRGFYACQHNPGTCLRIFRICFGHFEKNSRRIRKKTRAIFPKNSSRCVKNSRICQLKTNLFLNLFSFGKKQIFRKLKEFLEKISMFCQLELV